VVCGTAGPGVTHFFNGLMDARKEGAPITAIAGDVETSVIDTAGLEELNPYQFFDARCTVHRARGETVTKLEMRAHGSSATRRRALSEDAYPEFHAEK
jgi:thiamine pyrophosphate-dependent acetolactate synthase large subunit-like protein